MVKRILFWVYVWLCFVVGIALGHHLGDLSTR